MLFYVINLKEKLALSYFTLKISWYKTGKRGWDFYVPTSFSGSILQIFMEDIYDLIIKLYL